MLGLSTLLLHLRRMDTESAVADYEPDFKGLVEGIADVIWSADVDGDLHVLTYLSPQFKTMFGFEPHEWLGRSPYELVHPDDVKTVAELVERQSSSKRLSFELRHLCQDGSYLWVSLIAVSVLDDHGNLIRRQGTIRDISERKRLEKEQARLTKYKTAELAWKDAHSQVRDMTENVPGVIARLVLHPDGGQELAFVSSRVRDLYELDRQALMADVNEFWRLVHPDDLEATMRDMYRSAEALEPLHSAFRLVLEGRGTRWVEAWALPSQQDNGDIVFDGIVIDVTDLGRMDSLERDINFRQIFDNAPEGVFLIVAGGKAQGRIAAANRAAEQMHGYQAGELIGKTIMELDAPNAALEAPERISRLAKGEVLRFELEHVHRDGSVFPVEVTASRITIGGRAYILAFDRDITDRKKAEAERRELQNQVLKTQKLEAELDLAKTQSQLRKMTENIPGVVYQYVVHADGNDSVTYIGAHCREMFGVKPEEVLDDAETLFKWIHQEDIQPLKEAIAHSTKTLERFVHEFRVAVPDQGVRWYRDLAQPVQQPNGDVIWDGVILDVTDRREVELANEVLAKATKSKDMFLANMSHELRTPLTAILGMTEGLKQGIFGETSGEQLQTLGVIEDSGLHLLNLINEILDLAKIETGNTLLNYSTIDVSQLSKSCLDLVSPEANRKRIRMSVDMPWKLPALRADKTRLRQILINLLGNALKFTPEGGEVQLKVEELSGDVTSLHGEVLRFTVTDNGIGIEPDRVDSIFEAFIQADGSFSRKYPGSGLGLALVKRFVELHSGIIDVQSEPGKGSQFTVDLPYVKELPAFNEVPNIQPAIPVAQPGDGIAPDNADSCEMPTILLAEDNDHVALAVTSILEASSFRVFRAVNGENAIELALAHLPDLILMDVQMPVMDGLEAIRRIRSNNDLAGKPIFALSGFAMEADSARCIEAGADLFLSKPFEMPHLISEIRKRIPKPRKASGTMG